MNSGWEARIGDPASFINAGEDGVLHFLGFTLTRRRSWSKSETSPASASIR